MRIYKGPGLSQVVVSRHWGILWKAHYCYGSLVKYTSVALSELNAVHKVSLKALAHGDGY